MNHYIVNKSSVNGEITIPSSKSHTLRAILFGAMGCGKSTIHNFLPSNDTFAMIEACKKLGAEIVITDSTIEIMGLAGKINQIEDVINAGNSGIILRFCTALGAISSSPIVVTGDHSIKYKRPMLPLITGLKQLGVSVMSMRNDDYAPIIIKGPIIPGEATIDGKDSQFVSALLIALAFADGPSTLTVTNAGEKPWVALTLDWFDKLQITYTQTDYESYELEGNSRYRGFTYTVPGDLSSAAFPIAAAIISNSSLVVNNIDLTDPQGDKKLIYTLQKMGANIQIDETNKTVSVKPGSRLRGMEIDINDFIDSITILAVMGCYAEGETRITNAAVARSKECNRIECITKELSKMGACISETADGLLIKNSELKGASLHSHHDHRMVMSLAVAAMGALGETSISDVECVSKTYPSFLKDFQKIQAKIEERSLS